MDRRGFGPVTRRDGGWGEDAKTGKQMVRCDSKRYGDCWAMMTWMV